MPHALLMTHDKPQENSALCKIEVFDCCLQSGMKEAEAGEIELGEMEGHILQHMVAHMYGKLSDFPDTDLLPLFMAADAHQVCVRHQARHKLHATTSTKDMQQHAFVALVCLPCRLTLLCLQCSLFHVGAGIQVSMQQV